MRTRPANGFDRRPDAINRAGRPKGVRTGRAKALAAFDSWIEQHGIGDKLRDAWSAAFDADPLGFWQAYIVPLLPRHELADAHEAASITIVEEIVDGGTVDRRTRAGDAPGTP